MRPPPPTGRNESSSVVRIWPTDRMDAPAGLRAERRNFRVGPDLPDPQTGDRPGERITGGELEDAGLAQSQHLDQLGQGHDRRRTAHADTVADQTSGPLVQWAVSTRLRLLQPGSAPSWTIK